MNEAPLEQFKGKNVRVVLSIDGEEVLGRVEAASPVGIILKYKGSSRAILLENEEIKEIELDKKEAEVKPSELRWPINSTVRKHLASHHGYKLSSVNEMANDQGMLIHHELHKAEDADQLGHYHPGSLDR